VIITTLAAAPLTVNTGVFKCKISESQIVYQSHPCTKCTSDKVEIKQRSAEKEKEEVAKLNTWKGNYALKEAAEKEITRANQEKAQEYRMRMDQVDAANEQASQTNALEKIYKKLNRLSRQQMLNNNEQQLL
jgi:putative ribosome biogenesis GTPase RsgA